MGTMVDHAKRSNMGMAKGVQYALPWYGIGNPKPLALFFSCKIRIQIRSIGCSDLPLLSTMTHDAGNAKRRDQRFRMEAK